MQEKLLGKEVIDSLRHGTPELIDQVLGAWKAELLSLHVQTQLKEEFSRKFQTIPKLIELASEYNSDQIKFCSQNLVVPLKGMEKEQSSENSNFIVYTIPGQNGLGSESDYVKEVLGNDSEISPVPTPNVFSDLGQSFCEKYLDQTLANTDKEGVVYATSQGTATVLNYLSKNGYNKKIKALVLEAVLASGNSAIYHTVTGPLMNMKNLERVPGSYYFVPYFANVACPGYRPAGKQAIKSIDNISTDLPIIIIHSKEDMQLPYSGACALYYRLRQNGNKNVYFITEEGSRHIQILGNDKKAIVKCILQKHLSKKPSNGQGDFSLFQPEPSQFKKQYDELISKEKNHTYVEQAMKVAVLAFIVKYIFGY